MCLWEACFGLSSWELPSGEEMADFNAPLSSSVLRNLSDKLYEKRKAAALEVQHNIAPMHLNFRGVSLLLLPVLCLFLVSDFAEILELICM